MPPILRGGKPLNQRLVSTTPQVTHLCECSACNKSTVVDRFTGKSVQGRYVGRAEYKEHRLRNATQASSGDSSWEPDLSSLSLDPGSDSSDSSSSSTTRSTASFTRSGKHRSRDSAKSKKSIDSFTLASSKVKHMLQNEAAKDKIGPTGLVFQYPPARISLPTPPSPVELLTANSGVFALDEDDHANAAFLAYEQSLFHALKLLEAEGVHHHDVRNRLSSTVLLSSVKGKIQEIVNLKQAEWERQRIARVEGAVYTESYLARRFSKSNPIVAACFLIVVVLHLLCGLSMEHCNFLLAGLRIIFSVISATLHDHEFTAISSAIPKDIRQVLTELDVEPPTKAFVCCPKCYCCYPFDPEKPESYPTHCTNRDTPTSSICNRSLKSMRRKGGEESLVPSRLFLYHSLQQWLAWMHSRDDIEQHFDREFCKDEPDDVWDIWDSAELRHFEGPDGLPFLQRPENEGRLIFSLNMDSFNPYMNREAGKKVSVGAIYMVCLNLPPSIRYRVENMYLAGIIPGPREPSLYQINHLLRPLVQDLLEFWTNGIYLSKTARHPNGRRVRCALIPLVCDLLAARQMSGFASHSAHRFCSYCTQTKDVMDNVGCREWTLRSYAEWLEYARQWRDAKSERERELLFEQSGVRWSELLLLPYWDPTRFMVIDAMHCFYLRLLHHHCRLIWGMDIKFADGDGISFDPQQNPPTEEEMRIGHKLLRTGTKTELAKLKVGILRQLCRDTQTLRFGGRKKRLLKDLLAYRIRNGWFTEDGIRNSDSMTTIGSSDAREKPEKAGLLAPKDAKKQITQEEALKIITTSSTTTINRLPKAHLVTICVLKLGKGDEGPEFFGRFTAPALRELIKEWRSENGITGKGGKLVQVTEKATTTTKTRVLGRGVLGEVRKDMERLKLPTWIAHAPSHPGEARHGKFSADQWRTFCTVNLVVTLTRLWGHGDKDSRERRMLDNFLHLVTAVKLASMRKMTSDRIKRYQYHIHQYLIHLLDLYPGTSITPYQHLALHFHSFLSRFGPTHAWRCFPFERYNYILQSTPTNMIFGELEQTILKRFCMGQKVRAMFQPDHIPTEVHSLILEYNQTFHSDIRGTLLNDILAFDSSFKQEEEEVTWTDKDLQLLSNRTHKLLQQWVSLCDHDVGNTGCLQPAAFYRSEITRLGQKFQRSDVNIADSNIVYHEPGSSYDPSGWAAGRIRSIFSHTRKRLDGTQVTQTFFLVEPYIPLSPSDARFDPFRRYPLIGGRIFYSRVQSHCILLASDDIHCHFASCEIEMTGITSQCIHVLPLDKD